MFKMRFAVVIAILALSVCAAFAEGLPSSKATADISNTVVCKFSTATVTDGTGSALVPVPGSCTDIWTGATVNTNGQWIQIMDRQVKLSNSQSLFVSPSLVTGLYTRTRTKTTTGSISTAQAMGAVYLRAVLTPAAGGSDIVGAPVSHFCNSQGSIFGCAEPETGKWGVILDSRVQTLTQQLSQCVIDVTSIPGTTNDGTCSFTSTIDLILNTTSANTFNFIFKDLTQGIYTLKIFAAVASSASIIEGSGTAIGASAFGLGSVTAESVRLVHDFEF